jgi:hypothetical protein
MGVLQIDSCESGYHLFLGSIRNIISNQSEEFICHAEMLWLHRQHIQKTLDHLS